MKIWIALAVIGMVATRGCLSCSCRHDTPPLRFATFNIEDFPKNQRQIDGAFAELARLDASFVAVQEITEPELFRYTAQERLGKPWDFVYASTAPGLARPTHHLGVLFDRRVWTFVSTTLHDETRLGNLFKPTLEVRLRAADVVVRVLVVHLKAGGDSRGVRARQYAALAGIVKTAQRSGERVVLLGDFNSTDDTEDRADLATLAKTGGLTWATEPLACSAFWDRDDGCFRSRLDHVLLWTRAAKVTAAGACASDGCDTQASCPRYADEVSDHCPVVIEVR